MRRTRQLGVKEGNAIETIVAFNMRTEKGIIATKLDRDALQEAYQVLGIHPEDNTVIDRPRPTASAREAIQNILIILGLCALGWILLLMVSYALHSLLVALTHP